MSDKCKVEYVAIVYKGALVKVKKEVADYLEDCRRDNDRQAAKKRRNQSAIRYKDDFIENFMATPPQGFESELIRRLEQERLPALISMLPVIQRRRLYAYYFESLTYQEIARREDVDHRAVMRSVKSALKRLKKYFE